MASLFDTTSSAVLSGYSTLYTMANNAFAIATGALETLGNIQIPEPPEIVAPTLPELDVELQLPADPSLPSLSTSLESVPSAPSIHAPSISMPDAPQFEDAPLQINLPPRPAELAEPVPAPPAIDYDVAIPDAPAIALPTEPLLGAIAIPDVPDIDVPEFTGIPPVAPLSIPTNNFSYAEEDYAQALDLQPAIDRMLSGLSGFPPEIEQALFDRARSREDISARKAVQEAAEEWSARGFSMPQGELARRVDEIRQRNQDAVNTLNRELTVRMHEVKVQDLRFAVQQGLAYEGQLIDLHNQQAARKLQAAELTARIALEYFNANVALYNAQAVAFNMQVEAYRVQLLESAQRIELYRGQLEAARVSGELNEQQVRLYAERVRAQLVHVEIYRGQIDAARAHVDLVRGRVEQYRAIVEGFTSRVEAKRAEFQAWGEQVRAEGQKADIYRATVSAFAERVRAYSSQVDGLAAGARAQVDSERLRIDAFQASLGVTRERINARAQQTQAIASLFDGQARIHTAKIGAVGEQARTTIAAYEAMTEAYRSQANVAIENVRVASENAGRNANLAMEAQRGIAQVAAQISAGTLSAINLSASIGASAGYDLNQSTTVNYSVDGGEQPPPILG